MDEELQKLLDELQKLTEGQAEQPKQEQSKQEQPPQTTPSQLQNNNMENQVKAWKEIGVVRFTAKYGNLPNSQSIQI